MPDLCREVPVGCALPPRSKKVKHGQQTTPCVAVAVHASARQAGVQAAVLRDHVGTVGAGPQCQAAAGVVQTQGRGVSLTTSAGGAQAPVWVCHGV